MGIVRLGQRVPENRSTTVSGNKPPKKGQTGQAVLGAPISRLKISDPHE